MREKIIKITKRIKLRTWIGVGLIAILLPIAIFRFIYSVIGATPVSSATWRMDEGSGSTVGDGSGNGNTATVTSATWKGKELCLSENCLFFDGNSDYVSRADDADFDFAAADSFSFSVWVRYGSSANGTIIVNKNGVTGGIYQINIESDGDITCGIDDDTTYGPEDFVTSTAATYDDNKWHNVVCVKNGTTSLTLYIDGVSVGTPDISFAATGTLANNGGFGLGANILSLGSGTDFLGFMDEFRMYREALDASEILVEYNKASAARFSPQDSDFLSEGLVGYWPMDESAANSCTGGTNDTCDKSGNLNNGAWAGDATFTTGKIGNATTYDGTGDTTTFADVLDSNFNEPLTLSAWVKTSTDGSQSLITKQDSSSPYSGYNLQTGAGGFIFFQLVNDYSSNVIEVRSTNDLNYDDGIWHHVVATYDGSSSASGVKIFFDGNAVATTTTLNNLTTTTTNSIPLNLGSRNAAAQYLNGQLDEARIYNRALTPGEVNDLYNWAPGPVGYWKFDDGSGSTVADSSGNNNPATITDGSTVGEWAIGKYGSTYNTRGHGSTEYITLANSLSLNTRNTISFWANFTSFEDGANGSVVGGNSTAADAGYMFYIDNTSIYARQSTGSAVSISNTLSLSTWYHISVVRDGTSIKFYSNGQQLGTTQTLGANNVFSMLAITNFGTGAQSFPVEGMVDDVRVYNYPRTQEQIIEDMNGGHPTGGSPLGTATSYWKFDEGYGTTAFDDIDSNSNDLTLSTASWTLSGKFDKAWNGQGGRWLSRADDADFDFAAADSFAISMWFKSDSATNPGATEWLLNKSLSGGTQEAGYAIYANTDGTVCFGIDDDTTWSPTVSSCTPTDIYDNTWRHILAVRDVTADQTQLYIDGELIDSDSDTTTATLANARIFYLGDRQGADGGDELNGDIDEVKIFRDAIDADQAKILYNASSASAFSVLGSTEESDTNFTGNPPVGWWKLDENTGTTGNDSSGNGFNTTLTGSPTFAPGKLGSALSVGSTSQYATYDDTGASALDTANSFTVEAWAKFNDLATELKVLAMKSSDGGTNANWYINTGEGANIDEIDCGAWDGTGGNLVTSGLNLTTNTWYHFACVFDNTANTVTLFVNGVRHTIATGVTVNPPTGNGDFYIGDDAAITWNGTPINGLVDEVRFYDYARTAAQIAYDFNRGGPLAWYKMDDCTGTTVNDLSTRADLGSALDGTWSGAGGGNTSAGTCTNVDAATAWYNGRNGKYNSSLDFDGTDDQVAVTNADPIDLNVGLTNGFTFSTWVYPNSDGETDVGEIFDKGTNTYCRTDSESGSRVDIECRVDLTTDAAFNVTSAIPINQWSHIAFSWTNDADDEVTIWINGVANTSTATFAGDPAADANNLTIGGTPNFDGQIDDFRVYPYELTETQIKKVMNEGAGARFGPVTGSP